MTKSLSRDYYLLMKILQNQQYIADAIKHFQCNAMNLHQNKMAFDLCAFYMAQIGENAKMLTDNTKQALPHLDIKSLVYFRNMVDHTYEKVDKVVLKAYIFNMINKETSEEIKKRIKYCYEHAKRRN